MSELAEFLLARIASDEGEANYLRNVGVQGPQFGSVNGVLTSVVDIVLADAKAKRLIVESCRSDYENSLTSGDDTTELAEDVLLAMASVYADHADYLEKWAL